MNAWWERQTGLLFALSGVSWALHHIYGEGRLNPAYLRLGPMQVIMLGLMMWLHGKFRRPVAVKKAVSS